SLPMDRTQSRTKAALWMAGWLSLMLVMAVAGRGATRELNVFQIMEGRLLLGFLVFLPMIHCSGGLGALRAQRPPLHAARNLVPYAAQLGCFFALTLISDRPGGRDRIHDADLDRHAGRIVSWRAHDGLEGGRDRAWPHRGRHHRSSRDRRDQSGQLIAL